MAERGVDVLLYGEHFFGLPPLAGGEQRANLLRAVRRGEVAVHWVSEVFREGILVGRNDHAAGRIVEARQLVEGNVAIPLEVARGAVNRDIAAEIAAPRERAGGVVADVAIDVGVHEIRPGARKARNRSGEFLPVLSAVDVDEGELQHAAFRGGPA